jgi:hypothetical protein
MKIRTNDWVDCDEVVRLHLVWRHMINRCTNEDCPQWKDYGGRGITVCPEWFEFSSFANWALVNGSKHGLCLDRIDNDLGYTPGNCHFVTYSANNRNRRSSHLLTAFGETKTIMDWSEDGRCVVPYWTLWKRVETGRAPEEAMTTKLHARNYK